jgi:hypothetical protein
MEVFKIFFVGLDVILSREHMNVCMNINEKAFLWFNGFQHFWTHLYAVLVGATCHFVLLECSEKSGDGHLTIIAALESVESDYIQMSRYELTDLD